ncbi:NADH dehydrogenase [Sporobacter termitidis DSM 10068]|uniref:NADH:ubiquinone reductase (non-electrogenic) n=1 Tax=Sporobacter termitidis DSM 10068 TaxID=1123282 RepID=A0A1M5Z063_9FIRM|nr:FAD-dependent oxidoreductase [Sporobacter termitidis]SHI17621.1 NADH dehydrogenase [Sporobacter termitidis DSM 10068]
MEKNIVIVGAGYAGVLTAKKLAKRLKHTDVRITIIDKHPYHTMLTELHEVAANRVPEDHVRISLKKIFARRKVDVRLDTVTAVDYDKKVVTGKNGSYSYDYLVIAAGSKPTYFGTPGAEEFSYKLWSFEDAVKLKHHIIDMFKSAVSETDPDVKRRLLTFYVVGAGFTGAEMMGDLAEWIPILCDEYELDRDLVRLVSVDAMDRVVPVFPEKVSAKADRRLRKMGVELALKTGVSSLGEGYIELKRDGELRRDSTATVIWTAGVEGAELVKQSAGLKIEGRGRLKTDDYLHAEGRSDVFVAGDDVFYIPEGQKAPVPQMVENAEQSADTVAHNIVVAVTGAGEMEKYAPKFHGAMLSVGGRYACAHIGGQNRRISLASFFAMLSKHFINVLYFIQILGWNKVSSYLGNEFFKIRNRRSFLGGHFSNRTPSFLLVPLRVFFGAFWIYEGIQKITEGWLSGVKLADYFKSASDVFTAAVQSGTAGAAADAVSSATTADGGAAASVILNWNILGIFKIIMIQASDVAVKVQLGLMDWFNSTFLTNTAGHQMFFQYVVVISEILIGALLIVGLFTFLSSGYSLVLQVMFLMSTGMFMAQWWMIFAAIALLIGAGRTIGLDYYVMPSLKKHWKNTRIARKLYIYND